jgi:parvulin-like peptidyl-prolyl isomerase
VPRRIRKAAPALLVAIALGTGLAACGDDGADLPAGVVAQVGDAPIRSADLDRALKQREVGAKSQGAAIPEPGSEGYDQLRQQALDTLVQQRIVDFEARKCGEPCKVTKADIDERIAQIKEARRFSDADFAKFLKDNAITPADARALLKADMQQDLLFDHVTRGVRFTADDAKKYYDAHPSEFRRPAGRTVSHILLKTKAEAEALRAQATPENFNELAKEHSTDPSAATNGGDLGELTRGSGFVPEFENAAFELKDNEISQPVKTQFGWHLILVHLRPASTTSFEDAREGIIRTQLQKARQDTFVTWRDKVLAEWRAKTEYAESKLEPPEPASSPETDSTD